MVDTGIPGVGGIDSAAHLCAFYSGQVERERLVLPFLREGLRQGDRCVYLSDQTEPQDLRDRLGQLNDTGQLNDAKAHRSLEQLEVERAERVCERAGRFSIENMIDFLAGNAPMAPGDDLGGLRAAGEMPRVLAGPPGADDFFAYESAINRLVSTAPALLMFMYDLELFGTSMLVDVLKTHPTVLVGGAVLANPHFLTPHQYLETRRPLTPAGQSMLTNSHLHYPLATTPASRRRPGRAGDGWASLTRAEHRIALLVARGLTNKLIAQRLTLSRHTVDAHLKHMFTKLAIHSRVELTVLALKHHGSATTRVRT